MTKEISIEETKQTVFELISNLNKKEKAILLESVLSEFASCLYEEPTQGKRRQNRNAVEGRFEEDDMEYDSQIEDEDDNDEQEEDYDYDLDRGDQWLHRIAKDIKDYNKDRIDALAPDEDIVIPKWSNDFQGYEDNNTLHVDSFLYTQDDVDDMIEEGLLPTHRCLDCESTNVQELNFISHSMDRIQLKFLFNNLLKDYDWSSKVLLDVGSRLGAVLFAAAAYTNCQDIRGIEINDHFCKLQNHIIKRNKLSNKIKIIKSDVLSAEGKKLVQEADVLIMNNVFQFFVGGEQSRLEKIWNELLDMRLLKSGQTIVSVPSLEEQFQEATITEFDFSKKLKRITFDDDVWGDLDVNEEGIELCARICLYQVL